MKVKLLFFTTPTCSLCKVIKDNIEKGMYENLDIHTLSIETKDDFLICVKHGVRSFPSIVNKETNQVIVGQLNCLQYLEEVN